MTFLRIYQFLRRSGMPPLTAIRRAWAKAWEPSPFTSPRKKT